MSLDGKAKAPKAPFLLLRDADVRRNGKSILKIDSLSIPEGESVALLGPNGSGKTTFVNLVTREVFPLHRDIAPVVYRGNERVSLEQVRHEVGIVSASMQKQVSVHLKALDVVVGGVFGTLGIHKRFTPTEAHRQAALDAMEQFGIADLAERDMLTLSSGQARRVLIARALVANPDVVVFDEPCTGLDPEGMYHVRKSMRKMAQTGHAIMLVTHYLEDIVPEIGRVILIEDGQVFGAGTKDEMLTSQNMQSLFHIPAEVAEKDGYYSLTCEY